MFVMAVPILTTDESHCSIDSIDLLYMSIHPPAIFKIAILSFVSYSHMVGMVQNSGKQREALVYHLGAFIISMNRASVSRLVLGTTQQSAPIQQPTQFIVDLIDTIYIILRKPNIGRHVSLT